jgi:peptidoglycan hydrolase CwlO-like protein
MAEKKERFEILLEEIKGDVKLVLEGHGALDKKIDDVRDLIKEVDAKVDDTGKAVKDLAKTLREHVSLPVSP